MEAARASIIAKIEALLQVRESINSPAFAFAVRTIEACPGKLIVSGMGKSGHIGRKIAATFQSIGRRASFLHPGEAAHGDMGMIGPGDCLLLLSNSGETEELIKVAIFGRDRAIVPVICITSCATSLLAGMSDAALVYARLPEGDPLDLAPMSSTCVQLAIGDAIAAELMSRSEFTREHFAIYHHGGYLGRQTDPGA